MIKTSGEASSQIAARRQTDPSAFVRDLRGDLDWIVMKALERQPDRRYASVSEFAADVKRYLEHEPVVARPPTTAYRVRKFVRRHRVGVALAVVIVGLLVAGAVGTTVGLIRSRRSEQRALREATTAETLADYFVDIFRSADPDRGRSITAQEILDAKARTVREDEALAGEPGVRGRVMGAMGEAYMGLGLFGDATSLMEEALPLLRASYGDETPEVYNLLNELGQLASKVGDDEAARAYLERALALAEQTVGADHPHLPPIVKNLGDVCRKLGDLPAARRYLERSLNYRVAAYGAESMAVARTLGSMSQLAADSGDLDQALELARRSLETRQSLLDPDDPGIGHGYLFLADVQREAGDYEGARENYEAALTIWERALGPEHENVRAILLRLARTHLAIGDVDQAYESYERSLAIARSAYPADDPNLAPPLARYLDQYAEFLDELGRNVEAGELRAEAAGLRERHGLPR
jgi:tetratricopeptide (TPR) repeat protein